MLNTGIHSNHAVYILIRDTFTSKITFSFIQTENNQYTFWLSMSSCFRLFPRSVDGLTAQSIKFMLFYKFKSEVWLTLRAETNR